MNLYVYAALVALPYPAAPVPAWDEAAAQKAAEVCFEAIRKRDWKALAASLHPDSLEAFKTKVTPALKRAAAPRVDKDGVPDFQDGIVLILLEKADPKGLLALPPKEFFAAFVKATLSEGGKRLFGGMQAKVVGSVREGRDVIHVLYRASGKVRFAEGRDDQAGGKVKQLDLVGEVTRLGTLTVKRSGGGWKAVVPGELQDVADMLSAEWKVK